MKKSITFVGISMTFQEAKIRTTLILQSHQHIWNNNERLCNRIFILFYFIIFLYGNNNWRTLFGYLLAAAVAVADICSGKITCIIFFPMVVYLTLLLKWGITKQTCRMWFSLNQIIICTYKLVWHGYF